jgi:hypothetical protein
MVDLNLSSNRSHRDVAPMRIVSLNLARYRRRIDWTATVVRNVLTSARMRWPREPP